MLRNKKMTKGVLESFLSLSKIVIGVLMGYICGSLGLQPLLGLLLWILSIAIIVACFRFLIGLEDHPLKLSLLHGTFASFISFVFVWALVMGPP